MELQLPVATNLLWQQAWQIGQPGSLGGRCGSPRGRLTRRRDTEREPHRLFWAAAGRARNPLADPAVHRPVLRRARDRGRAAEPAVRHADRGLEPAAVEPDEPDRGLARRSSASSAFVGPDHPQDPRLHGDRVAAVPADRLSRPRTSWPGSPAAGRHRSWSC